MNKEKEINSIKSYRCLCELEPIKINGIKLDYNDFGEKYDTDPNNKNAIDYDEYDGCGNMQFIPNKCVNQDTLKKYNITEEEYREIQKKLDCLSFGDCGLCI